VFRREGEYRRKGRDSLRSNRHSAGRLHPEFRSRASASAIPSRFPTGSVRSRRKQERKPTVLFLIFAAVATWPTGFAEEGKAIPATIRADGLTSDEVSIYQHLWRISQTVRVEEGRPVPIVLETLQGVHTFAFEGPPETGPDGPFINATIGTFVLNPRYVRFPFGGESLRSGGLTGEVNLAGVLDALVEASNGNFIWRYDAENRVVNVVERVLFENRNWPLNGTAAGVPFTATGPIEALNHLAGMNSGSDIKPEAPAARALSAMTDKIEVGGETLRQALNCVLSTTSGVHRYYHVLAQPPLNYGENLNDWLNRENPRWGITWNFSGFYSAALGEEKRRIESGKRYIIPGMGGKGE
jgi:hypothetical protein